MLSTRGLDPLKLLSWEVLERPYKIGSRALRIAPSSPRVATATAVAGVVGAPLAALFLSLNGLGGLRGWRWLFIFEALPAALLAVVTWVYTPSPLDTTWLSSAERAALAALTRPRAEHGPSVQLAEVSGSPKGAALAEEGALSADDVPLLSPSTHLSQESVDLERPSAAPAAPADPEAPSAVKSAFRHVVRDPRLWYLGIIMMLIDWSMNSINLWLPQILMASLKSEVGPMAGMRARDWVLLIREQWPRNTGISSF